MIRSCKQGDAEQLPMGHGLLQDLVFPGGSSVVVVAFFHLLGD